MYTMYKYRYIEIDLKSKKIHLNRYDKEQSKHLRCKLDTSLRQGSRSEHASS